MVKALVTVLTLATLIMIAFSPAISSLVSRIVPKSVDGDCSECHGSFVAFEMEGTYPEVMPQGEEQKVRLKVSNTGEHEIRSSSASIDLSDASVLSFSGLEFGKVSESLEGTLSRGGSGEHPFDVTSYTLSIRVALRYDPGTVDLLDLDLSVVGPNGDVWPAQESGEEVIEIGRDEIIAGGAGQYSVVVTYARGFRSASYEVDLEMDRGPGRMVLLEGPSIGPGGSHTFEWSLIASGEGTGNVRFEVTSEVHHDHEGDEQDEAVYSLDGSWAVTIGEELRFGKVRTSVSSIDLGWVFGRVFAFMAASSFMVSVLLGCTIVPIKSKLEVLLGQVGRRRVHCIVSFIAVLSAAVHVLLLYTGLYAGTTDGLLLGGAALAGMMGISLTGVFHMPLSKKMGDKGWRRVHLWLTISVIAVICVHAVLEGTEFAFLR